MGPAGVDDTHAVRPDQANACLTDFGKQAGLECFSGRIGLGKSRRNDDDRLDGCRDAIVDHARDSIPVHRDHGEIDRLRNLANTGPGGKAVDLLTCSRDGKQPAEESRFVKPLEYAPTKAHVAL
jgi:hypothetical protein